MKSTHYPTFLDEARLWSIIAQESAPEPARIRDVLAKARQGGGLGLEEAAALLAPMPED